MAYRRIPRQGLHIPQRAFVRTSHEGFLDSPVLVAKENLQVVDRLSVALKTEVPWFDDPRVDRTHRYLVDLLPGDGEEVSLAAPLGVFHLPAGGGETDGLQPGVVGGLYLPELRYLPLEEVGLRDRRRQGGIAPFDPGRDDREEGPILPCQDSVETDSFLLGAEEGRQSPSGVHSFDDGLAKALKGEKGNRGERGPTAVGEEERFRHGVTPVRRCAA